MTSYLSGRRNAIDEAIGETFPTNEWNQEYE